MCLPIPPLKVSLLPHLVNRRPKQWSSTPMADRSFYSGHSVMSDFSEKEKWSMTAVGLSRCGVCTGRPTSVCMHATG